jgi:predicted anti-sigma-YlaC factor YlaD
MSRVAHIAVAASGLTPNPSNPVNDLGAMEKAYRRMVFLIATVWLAVVGAVLVYMVYRNKTGFALLFGAVLAVPLLTVPNFLIIVRRHKRRVATRESRTPD